MSNKQGKLFLGLLVSLLCCGSAFAQTSAFTYQGRLSDGGTPANGNYDLQFKIFDDAAKQLPVGSPITITKTGHSVSNGIFTVSLDFGAGVFTGADRFLEIAVRRNSGESFVPLSPRQPITSNPYAIRSANSATSDVATNANQLGGVPANQYVVTTDARMSDARNPLPNSTNYIQNTTTQQSASFNISGNGTMGGLTVDTNTLHVDAVNNRIGLGTISPASVLHVVGGAQPPPVSNNGGTHAPLALQVVGVKGGDTTWSQSIGGEGGGALIRAGNGGDAPTGGFESGFGGQGGSITLQPGMGGSGGLSEGVPGYVLLAPDGGSVGIGINSSHVHPRLVSPRLVDSRNNSLYIVNDSGDSNNFFRLDGFANNLYIVANSPHSFSSSGAGIIFRTAEAGGDENDRMAITPAGNAGIGTTAPSERLHVVGNGLFSGNLSVDTDTLRVDAANDKVGIGITSPAARLHITDNAGQVLFGGGGCGAGHVGLGFASTLTCSNYSVLGNGTHTFINRPAGGAIFFRENNADQLIISAGGAVSINTLGSAGGTQLCRNLSNQISNCSSSLRYKTNIAPFSSGLSFINRLRPVTFDWKGGGSRDVGFGAEDVAKINPLFVTHNDKGEIEGVKYDRLSVVFVNALREQQAQIEQQQREIDALKKLVCATNANADVCKPKDQ